VTVSALGFITSLNLFPMVGDRIDFESHKRGKMFEKDLAQRVEKTWGIKIPVTKTFGIRIYFLIGVGYKEYARTDLDAKKMELVKVGTDKKGRELYATYYFGDDY